MKRLLPAFVLVVLILATGPMVRELQKLVFGSFPSLAVRAMAAGFGLVAVVLVGWALQRIRHRRLLRYGGLGLTALLVWAMVVGFRQGQVEVDLVERIHILEYGLLAFLLYWALRPRADVSSMALPLLGVAIAGTLDEWWQWFVPTRTGEVRDVWINLSAGACGWLFSICLEPPAGAPWRGSARSWRLVARTASLAVLVLGLFYACAHLGHEIEDPEIGRFRSWHERGELLEVQARRAVEWAEEPPLHLAPYSRQDYYLTESVRHASHRNASLDHGDFYLAWQANLILEKYYGPFLDVVGFGGAGAHRWPEALRKEVRSKVPEHDPAGYYSPVLRERIDVRFSQGAFLTFVGLLSLGLFCLPWLLARR